MKTVTTQRKLESIALAIINGYKYDSKDTVSDIDAIYDNVQEFNFDNRPKRLITIEGKFTEHRNGCHISANLPKSNWWEESTFDGLLNKETNRYETIAQDADGMCYLIIESK